MGSIEVAHEVKDLSLAPAGVQRIASADREMPVLRRLREEFARSLPLQGIRIGACLPVTAETAALMRTLKAGGADVVLCAANPQATQDDVAAALVAEHGISVFAVKDESEDAYFRHVMAVADHRPQLTMDDGADVIGVIHASRRELIDSVIAGTEQTTAGVIRLRSMEDDGVLGFPVIAVSEAQTRQLFDNRYGTGQATLEGILRATGVLLAGATFVIAGYGWCGRGLAERARGMGARVIVLEVDPLRALQAVMDGFRVMTADEAASEGTIFCTATSSKHVLRGEHFDAMRDGAIIANVGYFNLELDLPALRERAVRTSEPRSLVECFELADGRVITLLAGGQTIGLAAGEGLPAAVADVCLASQALVAAYAVRNAASLENRVYGVPRELDAELARLKLATLGVAIDVLSTEQERYRASWSETT